MANTACAQMGDLSGVSMFTNFSIKKTPGQSNKYFQVWQYFTKNPCLASDLFSCKCYQLSVELFRFLQKHAMAAIFKSKDMRTGDPGFHLSCQVE
jgi:hypothetical protein